MGHPPRIPVWLRWEQSVIYFVTICVANCEPVLANERAFRAFKAAMSISFNYTTAPNIIFLAVGALLLVRFFKTGGPKMIAHME